MDPRAFAVLLIFACVCVVVPSLVLRYRRIDLRHRERMMAFDKGIPIPPDPPDGPEHLSIEVYHLRGLIWLSAGIGLVLTLFILMPVLAVRQPYQDTLRIQQLQTLEYSKSEIQQIAKDDDRRWEAHRENLRGFSALGIVPMAVGIAYLSFYYGQRRRALLK